MVKKTKIDRLIEENPERTSNDFYQERTQQTNKSPFDRSEFMKELHSKARIRRQIYEEKTGEQLPYHKFLRCDNPVDENIVMYEVTYQFDYQKFKMADKKNFSVIALKSPNVEDEIEKRTTQMFVDIKTPQGEGINQGLQKTIIEESDVDLKPRGMEQIPAKKLTPEDYEKIKQGDFVIDTVDEDVKIKNKSGKEYKFKIDLTHFM